MCLVPLKVLHLFFRSELGKSINTDEAAALGAVYQAAHLGKGFKVLTFGVKEANTYPLVVSTLYCLYNNTIAGIQSTILYHLLYLDHVMQKLCLWLYADSEGPDQPTHSRSDQGLHYPLRDGIL